MSTGIILYAFPKGAGQKEDEALNPLFAFQRMPIRMDYLSILLTMTQFPETLSRLLEILSCLSEVRFPASSEIRFGPPIDGSRPRAYQSSQEA